MSRFLILFVSRFLILFPQIPYQTLLDKYVLMSFVLLAFIGAQNAVSRILTVHLDGDDALDIAARFDWICLVAFLGLWLLVHAVLSFILLARPSSIYQPYHRIRTDW